MMRAYIVTVRPGTSYRYTDSVWIEKHGADQRACDLVEEFGRRGRGGKVEAALTGEEWGAWVTEIVIQDATLAPKKEKP